MKENLNKDSSQTQKLPDTKKCLYCRKDIAKDAVMCHYCHLSQGKFHWLRHAPMAVSFTMVLIAIAQVTIGLNQITLAKNERVDAQVALEKASKAKENIEKMQDEMVLAKKEVLEIKESAKDIARAVSEMAIVSFGEEEFFGPLDNTDLTEKKDYIREKLKSAIETLKAQDIDTQGLERIYHISK